jgi:preprotein translocase subunit SecE
VREPKLSGHEEPAEAPGAGRVQEILQALRKAHAAQGDEVAVAIVEDIKRLRQFMSEVPSELKKVTWPDWEQLRNATAVIIVFVLVVAGIIGLMDLVFREIINLTIRVLGA